MEDPQRQSLFQTINWEACTAVVALGVAAVAAFFTLSTHSQDFEAEFREKLTNLTEDVRAIRDREREYLSTQAAQTAQLEGFQRQLDTISEQLSQILNRLPVKQAKLRSGP